MARNVLLFAIVLGFIFTGCVKHTPLTQIVCTRPALNGKTVLVTVAPVTIDGETSERFTGTIETVAHTWLRGRGAHPVETPPYDLSVFGRVSVNGDAVGVTLKMMSGNEVVANGEGITTTGDAVSASFPFDLQMVRRAAHLAVENLCMTREREYVYTARPVVPETSPTPPVPPPYGYYEYGMYVESAPVYSVYGGHGYGGYIYGRSHPRVRTRLVPVLVPLRIHVPRVIKGDGGRKEKRHHRGGRHRDGGLHSRSPRR